MKDYNEMAESVFERRDKYHAERRMAMKKGMVTVACCCLVAVLGIGVWYGTIGTSTLPPAASEQPNNIDTSNDINIKPNIGNEGNVDPMIWLSADEVLKSAENAPQYMGVYVPAFVAYQGAIYGRFSEEYNENSQYARLETEVIFRGDYSYPAYQVKDISDSVAIIINGRLTTYQKLFEVNAVIDGTPYEVVYSMGLSTKYSSGEVVQENEDFTVYQAINPQSGEVMEAEYVINILPLLKRELPNFFDGDENYGDAWWVAVPQSNE